MKSNIQRAINKNEYAFYIKVRENLSKQDKVSVRNFINLLKSDFYFWVAFLGKSKPEKIDSLTKTSEALNAVLKVMDCVDSGIIEYPIDGLNKAKDELAYRLFSNQPLKTGGRRSKLSSNDLLFLYILRQAFRECFPHLSGNFVRDNMLCSLGKDLLDKSIPKSVNEMIEEFLEANKNYRT